MTYSTTHDPAIDHDDALTSMVRNATTGELLTVLAGERAGLAYAATLRLRPMLAPHFHPDVLDPASRARLRALGELYERLLREPPATTAPVRNSRDAARLFASMAALDHEEMHVGLLARTNAVIAVDTVAMGGLGTVHVTPQQIFRLALRHNASAILLAHNHPSGSCEPSADDVRMTQTLAATAEQVGIALLDHIIITAEDRYFSFADADLLRPARSGSALPT
jgi:hypothetical protein